MKKPLKHLTRAQDQGIRRIDRVCDLIRKIWMQKSTKFSLRSTSLTNSKACKSWRIDLKTSHPNLQGHWAKLISKKKAWCSLMNNFRILNAITWSILLSFKKKPNRFWHGWTICTIIMMSSPTTLTTKFHFLKVESPQMKPDFWTSRLKWVSWVKGSPKTLQSSSKASKWWNRTFTRKE